MDPLTMIAAVQTAIKVGGEALDLVKQYRGRLSEKDEKTLREAIGVLSKQNDELYTETLKRLDLLGGQQ